jgi:hypothetical protein
VSRRGHVYKRGDSWTFILDTLLPGQRRRQKSKGGYRTKRDALTALNEAQSTVQRGIYVEPSKLSVKTFLVDHWLPAIESGLRKSTFEGYRSAIRSHVIPHLGEMRLQALTPDGLNAFYATLLKEGRRDGKGSLGPKTVHNVHVMLHKAHHDAVRWNYLPRNVAEFSDHLVRSRRARRCGHGPRRSSGTSCSSWRMTRSSPRGFYRQVPGCGAARYSAFGGKTSTSTGGAWPSAKRSSRSTTASRCPNSRLRADDDPLRWTARRSRCCERQPDRFTQMFDKRVNDSGLLRIRLHDLRHTHATLALAAGIHPKVVSERLGHSTVAFTMDVYSHAIPSMEAEAAETIANLVRGKST